MLGLRSEREVRGSKIRDGEGQSRAGGMVRRDLGRQGQVLREADARCTASTAAPAAERERDGREGKDTQRERVCYNTGQKQCKKYTTRNNTPTEH